MRAVMDDAAPDDETINEIADSPALWWSVQRNINEQKQVQRTPWPPIAKLWRRGWINIPAFAAVVLVISFFMLRPERTPDQQTDTNAYLENPGGIVSSINEKDPRSAAPSDDELDPTDPRPAKTAVVATRTVPKRAPVRTAVRTAAVPKKSAEIKTDFIALSYARNPESGQIVRVRVPSSMMVTLGLVSAVEKPSALVDAEVVVGDDGLTHAIRFIR